MDEINKVLQLILKYENYGFMAHYNVKSYIYNFDKFCIDYLNEVSNDKDMLFEDLIYLFVSGYIDLFIPDKESKYFYKKSEYVGNGRDPYPFLENLCELYENIKHKKCNKKAIIYFTKDGDIYRKERLLEYTIEQVLDKQKELQKEQNNLKDKINSFSKEIISIVAIILAIAPLIVINVSALKNFTPKNLLVINGCLIIAITTICSVLTIAFLKLKREHGLLFVPLIIGIGLLLLSLKF